MPSVDKTPDARRAVRRGLVVNLARLKPAVPKCWLFAASGLMWSAVGLGMCAVGVGWLGSVGMVRAAGFGAAGLVLALAAVRWPFGAVAAKNIRRLRQLPDRGCVFAFQAWQSYLLVALMIGLGAGLRHAPVSREVLSVLYIGIGGALLTASRRYYGHLSRLRHAARRRS